MTFHRYPKYKASGVEWLGEVPEGWDISKLKYAAQFASGGTPSKTVLEYWDGDVPWASSKDLKVDALSDTEDHITERAVADGARLIDAGDIMVVVRGMILAHTFPVTKAVVPMAINQDLKAIRPHADWHSDYFACLLRAASPETFRRLDEAGHGTKALRMEAWVGMGLPRPPLSEQHAIATFLDRETAKLDALIAEQERLIELLKEKRQAVISHPVTKGLDPSVHMKPSGVEWLGEVPEHWGVTRIANLFREVTEPGSDDLPILSVSIHHGVSDSELDEEELDRKVTRSDDRSKYKRVQPGDLVYNMMRAWQGAFGAVTVAGMVSPAYVVARPEANVDTEFVEHLLRTPQAIEQMRRHSRGITDFRLRLYWEEFKNLRVVQPPVGEAKKICAEIGATVDRFDSLTPTAQRAIELLQERRTALISAAVTGQIDVRG